MNIGRGIRNAISKNSADAAPAVIERDAQSPAVDVPEDLIWALDMNEQAKARFDKFAYSHRKAYVEWIEGARKPETRQRRIEQAIAMIVEGKKKV